MTLISRALRLALPALVLSLAADVASACNFACVNVGPDWCQSCRQVSYPTGGYCEDVAPCVCIDIQGICFNSNLATEAEQLLSDLAEPAEASQPAASRATESLE
jgi:hypothetical protein